MSAADATAAEDSQERRRRLARERYRENVDLYRARARERSRRRRRSNRRSPGQRVPGARMRFDRTWNSHRTKTATAMESAAATDHADLGSLFAPGSPPPVFLMDQEFGLGDTEPVLRCGRCDEPVSETFEHLSSYYSDSTTMTSYWTCDDPGRKTVLPNGSV